MSELWPFQAETPSFVLKAKKMILGDDMGLGKTIQSLTTISSLPVENPSVLVVAGKNAQYAWYKQCLKWGYEPPVRITGTPAKRAKLWASRPKFCTCTWQTMQRDINVMPQQWTIIIADEAHKATNRKTKNYKSLKQLSSTYLMLVTGSAIRRGPQNLWALLNLCDPKKFSSYWRFVNEFCIVIQGMWGMEIIGLRNQKKYDEVIAPYVLRRTKRQVRPQMPPKNREFLPIAMDAEQTTLYNKLTNDLLAQLSDGSLIATPNPLTLLLRHRQLLVTPKLIDPQMGYGAGLERVVEMLEEADNQHMVIFTPFAKALPYIEARLIEAGYEHIIKLQGGIKFEEMDTLIEGYRQNQGIALCTIQFAESFDLIPANWGVFLGFDWDAETNHQAEDRLHRGEIEDPVNYYYMHHLGTVEDRQVEVLDGKQRAINAAWKPSIRQLKEFLGVPKDSS